MNGARPDKRVTVAFRRIFEPREHRYVYANSDGTRMTRKKQVFDTRPQQPAPAGVSQDIVRVREAEGYRLVPSFTNASGYRNVRRQLLLNCPQQLNVDDLVLTQSWLS